MKKNIFFLILIFISCKTLKNQSEIKSIFNDNTEKFIVTLDTLNKEVFINTNSFSNISAVSLNKQFNQKIKTKSGFLKYGDEIELKTKNGYSKYVLRTYTNNLVSDKNCSKEDSQWEYGYNTSVTKIKNKCVYEIIDKNTIGQTIKFSNDYSGKYLLFICMATTEKFVKNSITRIPYLWGSQGGKFKKEDWIYMADNVTFKGPANNWEKIYGINKLLNNVSSVWVQMSQGLMKGDDSDGTKSKYYNMEVRVFESESDAKFFVKYIYQTF